MAVEIKSKERKFFNGTKELPDPGANLPVAVAIKMLKAAHPELVNAKYSSRVVNGIDEYHFNEQIGTYG